MTVLYDADADCLKQMEERATDKTSEIKAFPYFFGSQTGHATLNINYDPYTSSSGILNDRYANYYLTNGARDYVVGDVFQPVETREIEVISLDEIPDATDNTLPIPDFFSMDVCGMGNDIFVGAEKTLRTNVLGVVDNMFFHSFYQDQKLMSDNWRLLDKFGFDFTGFGTNNFNNPVFRPENLEFLLVRKSRLKFKSLASIYVVINLLRTCARVSRLTQSFREGRGEPADL